MPKLLALALVTILSASTAFAENDSSFGIQLGVGYSHVDNDSDVDLLDDGDSAYANIGVSYGPFDDPGLRFGAAFLSTAYRDTDDIEGTPLEDDYDQEFGELFLYQIEARAAWYQPIAEHFFIEPGIGVGVTVGHARYGQEDDDHYDGEYIDEDTSAGLGIRPMLSGGVRWGGHFMLGVEGSYLWTTLDFEDGLGDNFRETRVGAFFRYIF